MKHAKQFGALALALTMALTALAGCGSKNPGTTVNPTAGSGSMPDASSEATAQVTPMDLSQVTDPFFAVSGLAGKEVVAKLGETEISAADYLYWLNRVIDNYLSQFGGQMTTLPWDAEMAEGITFGQYMQDQAMDAATFHCMLRELARQEGVSPDPSIALDMDKQYADMVVQAGSNEEQVIHTLWASMLTKEIGRAHV